MKRIVGFLLVAGFLAVLPLSHLATADKPEDKPPAKVMLCHIDQVIEDYVDEDTGETGELRKGKVIEVSVKAEPAHLGHGDHHADADAAIGDPCSKFYPDEG